MARLTPYISSAASLSTAATTAHNLTGRAEELLMCSNSSAVMWYYTFATGATTYTTDKQYVPGDTPILIGCDMSTCIWLMSGGTTGLVYITEFIR